MGFKNKVQDKLFLVSWYYSLEFCSQTNGLSSLIPHLQRPNRNRRFGNLGEQMLWFCALNVKMYCPLLPFPKCCIDMKQLETASADRDTVTADILFLCMCRISAALISPYSAFYFSLPSWLRNIACRIGGEVLAPSSPVERCMIDQVPGSLRANFYGVNFDVLLKCGGCNSINSC